MDWREQGPKWDNGQKVYASAAAPLILGCVGNGLYAAHVAPRVLAYAECILQSTTDPAAIVGNLGDFAASALRTAPARPSPNFELVIGLRQDLLTFQAWVLQVSKSGVSVQVLPMPQKSGILFAAGTGADFVRDRLSQWQRTKASDTSRAIYSAFCDALLYKNPPSSSAVQGLSKDPFSEGPPQLVGLYRKWNARHFGTIWRRGLYFGGIKVSDLPASVECRNDLFERCDPTTLRRMAKAKGHIDEVAASKRRKSI